MSDTTVTEGNPGRHVDVNGLKMYYEEFGSGKPLILIHGGTVTSSAWQLQIPFFAQQFRVITPHSRGHGRTDNPTGEFSYRLMAEDMADLIRALDLDGPMIFGYSDGGQIALEIGMLYPGLTSALVFGAASHTFSESYFNAMRELGFEGPGVVNIERTQKAAPELVDLWKTEHVRDDDPDYWLLLLEQISKMFWTQIDYAAEDFESITDPVLILLGDRDEMVPVDQALHMYQLIPTAELAILPNMAHMSNDIRTDELAMETVLDFLLRHGQKQ